MAAPACIRCGYDLSGFGDSIEVRCPECGRVAPTERKPRPPLSGRWNLFWMICFIASPFPGWLLIGRVHIAVAIGLGVLLPVLCLAVRTARGLWHESRRAAITFAAVIGLGGGALWSALVFGMLMGRLD